MQALQRQLFASSADELRLDIKRITEVEVREATTGTVVQVFLLAKRVSADSWSGNGSCVPS